jgi:sulfatase maturation enzyme AslB (radical SAM superfamily)
MFYSHVISKYRENLCWHTFTIATNTGGHFLLDKEVFDVFMDAQFMILCLELSSSLLRVYHICSL